MHTTHAAREAARSGVRSWTGVGYGDQYPPVSPLFQCACSIPNVVHLNRPSLQQGNGIPVETE